MQGNFYRDADLWLESLANSRYVEGLMNTIVFALILIPHLFQAVKLADFPVLLREAQRPELSIQAVMNLLSVFRYWRIHNQDVSGNISAALNNIEVKYKNDGYVLGMRVGTRRYSGQEEANITQLIAMLRSQNLAKLKK